MKEGGLKDGEIHCDQEPVGAIPMQMAIDSLLEDPDFVVCAFNNGSEKKGFPDHYVPDQYDPEDKTNPRPEDFLSNRFKGWTRAGVCKHPGGNAGIFRQTYVCALLPLYCAVRYGLYFQRWGAPHFCKTQRAIAVEAQAIKDKCTTTDKMALT